MPFFVSVCAAPPRGVIVLCAGDSITAEAYPHFLQKLLNREGVRARVLNYGRSGNTSGEYLSFLRRNGAKLRAERPDVVLLQLGTNDVREDVDRTPADRFAANMKDIVSFFRSLESRGGDPPRVLLATIPPLPAGTEFPFTAESVRRVEGEINPAVRALARAEDLPLVDNHALFAGRPELLPGVHPTRDGYRFLAENWLAALLPFVSKE
jgi:lysophospholipase L1-like esterase